MATLRSEDDEPLALKTAQTADGPYSLKNTLTVSSPASVIEPHGPESPSSAAEGTHPSTRGDPQNQNDSVMLESTNELVRGPFVDSLMEDRGADLIPAKDGTTPNDAGSDLCPPMKRHCTNQKTDLVACPKCTGLASGIHECLRNIQLLNDRLYAYQQRLRMSDHEQKHGDDVSKQHLQDLLDSANAENANLRSQLNDLLNRFKDAKIKADRRAELLHHVMSEYNAMEKEYELMKTASTSIQKKNEMLQQQVSMQEESLYQLERSVQLLEAENNELRRSRIIDANTKTWYGKCTHSCATHPRTYPYAYSTRHKDIKQGDAETEDQEARCKICAEAEKWAEGIIQKPAYWSESLRRHNEATLPLRGQDAKPGRETLESTTEHTIFTMPSAPPPEQKQQQQQPSTGIRNVTRCHQPTKLSSVDIFKATDMESLITQSMICDEASPVSIALEKRYRELQLQKRYLETCLSKVPLHKFDKNRISTLKWKEDLEAKLDRTDAELGSVRLSLRKLNAFK